MDGTILTGAFFCVPVRGRPVERRFANTLGRGFSGFEKKHFIKAGCPPFLRRFALIRAHIPRRRPSYPTGGAFYLTKREYWPRFFVIMNKNAAPELEYKIYKNLLLYVVIIVESRYNTK